MWLIHSVLSCFVNLAFNLVRTSLTSPITLAVVGIFLLISAGSISIWRTFAFLANFLALPVTLSLNLTPIAISKSHSVTPKLDVFVPCIPNIPVYKGLVPSNAPLPISESHTGAFTFSTNSFNSSDAPDITAPPPTKIYGFLDFSINLTAFSISSSVIFSVERSIFIGSL